jgi:hypothetical protein
MVYGILSLFGAAIHDAPPAAPHDEVDSFIESANNASLSKALKKFHGCPCFCARAKIRAVL